MRYELAPETAQAVLGINDANLKVLNDLLDVDIHVRGTLVTITGEPAEELRARKVLNELQSMARRGHVVSGDSVKHVIGMVDKQHVGGKEIVARRGKVIRPKTAGQRGYVEAIDDNTVVFAIGPAGSGKTYLAMAKAVEALNRKEVNRIILTRPAVEAGEKLGFLPGTLGEKIDPYLRPLHDALRDMLEPEAITKMMESGIIEVAPLAYMRGRTLNDAFVILDEAQNTTPAQMKMFLTRLGFGSTMVITGDTSQVDLPRGVESGLKVASRILGEVPGISFHHLNSDDVVRHQIVSAIVDAYDREEALVAARRAERRAQKESGAWAPDHAGTGSGVGSESSSDQKA